MKRTLGYTTHVPMILSTQYKLRHDNVTRYIHWCLYGKVNVTAIGGGTVLPVLQKMTALKFHGILIYLSIFRICKETIITLLAINLHLYSMSKLAFEQLMHGHEISRT